MFPKPVKRATVKRARDQALHAKTAAVRGVVFERDDYQCRIVPGCQGAGVNLELELVHLKAKGPGGDHGLRTNSANCICGCRQHHQGARSLHSGHIQYRCLTDRGADGPLVFLYYEAIGSHQPLYKGDSHVPTSSTR